MKHASIHCDLDGLHTNILLVNCSDPNGLAYRLQIVTDDEESVLKKRIVVRCFPHDAKTLRLVTNLNVTRTDAEQALQKFKFLLKNYDQEDCNHA